MIKVRAKSGTIELCNLNDDCNYELNQQPIISSLSYIAWDICNLKVLDKYKLIDWYIYSENDLTTDVVEIFYNKIDVERYLSYIESKYKSITDDIVQKLTLFMPSLNNGFVKAIQSRVLNNKEFYLNSMDFLRSFKFTIDLYNISDCIKYINSSELFKEFIMLIPLSLIDQLLPRITIEPDSLDYIFNCVVQRFSNYKHEQNNIIGVFFITQAFSFEFIMSKTWTYSNWIHILQHQTLNDEQLLTIMTDKKYGLTLRPIICKYKTLGMEFIEKNINLLDMDEISKSQPLTYEFVKSNVTKLNLEKLIDNENINFLVTEINNDSLLGGPQYVIAKNINTNERVLFID